jgi:hypothetical protein
MPKIPEQVIHSVFYLYASREDALAGRNPGGTGFIVQQMVPGVAPFIYGVSNWHVVCDGGWSVIRLNRNDGGVDVIELGPEDWEFLPGKYDVAIVPLNPDTAIHKYSTIPTHLFAKRPDPTDFSVGDDVFMIGLFVDHDGTTTNVPSARFGNISMLPNERAKIEQPTGYKGVSYVVDMHSRSGFSGSPVFVYRTFGSDLTEGAFGHPFENFAVDHPIELDHLGTSRNSGRLRVNTLFNFLGIHWGQFPETWELRDKSKLAESNKRQHLVTEGGYVEGLSGMTCVIPAWEILEVLNMPKFKTDRDRALTEKRAERYTKPKPESASPLASDANHNHREDFERLLGKAAKPQKDE